MAGARGMPCSPPTFEGGNRSWGKPWAPPRGLCACVRACIHAPSPAPSFALDPVLSSGEAALKEADQSPMLMEWGFLTQWCKI